jgi:hypothetical protein
VVYAVRGGKREPDALGIVKFSLSREVISQ